MSSSFVSILTSCAVSLTILFSAITIRNLYILRKLRKERDKIRAERKERDERFRNTANR